MGTFRADLEGGETYIPPAEKADLPKKNPLYVIPDLADKVKNILNNPDNQSQA